MKRYGPYKHKRLGYTYYVEVDAAGKRKTVYEHRDVMEKSLQRALSTDEIVHHKNEVKADNGASNLAVTSVSDHSRLHARERYRDRESELLCASCNRAFTRRKNWKRKTKVGDFCSRACWYVHLRS